MIASSVMAHELDQQIVEIVGAFYITIKAIQYLHELMPGIFVTSGADFKSECQRNASVKGIIKRRRRVLLIFSI